LGQALLFLLAQMSLGLIAFLLDSLGHLGQLAINNKVRLQNGKPCHPLLFVLFLSRQDLKVL